jgi:hypothetical protein
MGRRRVGEKNWEGLSRPIFFIFRVVFLASAFLEIRVREGDVRKKYQKRLPAPVFSILLVVFLAPLSRDKGTRGGREEEIPEKVSRASLLHPI